MHFLTGTELESSEIEGLLDRALELKSHRKSHEKILSGRHLALVFEKPSVRTRFSFTIAMRELGGHVVESVSSSRKNEEPQDLAQVLGGYCDGVMVRTHEDTTLHQMAGTSPVPIINGLSELHHPCQALSDLMTLKERFGDLDGLTLSYFGDGNNVLHSLLLLAPPLGVHIRYACPAGYRPKEDIVKKAQLRAEKAGTTIQSFDTPSTAAKSSNALYTDVWTSMGFEEENAKREFDFRGFQLNESLMDFAEKDAVAMHCLPMERGREISRTLPDTPSSVIFAQSENRLHAQKALLIKLLGE